MLGAGKELLSALNIAMSTIETDVALLRADLSRLEALHNERFSAQEKAVQVALEANNKRLDSMNEFRATLADQATQLITRSEAVTAIQTANNHAEGQIVLIKDKLEELSKPNYVLASSILSAMFVLIAGSWLVIGLKIESATSPLAISVSQLTANQQIKAQQITGLSDDIRSLQRDMTEGHAKDTQAQAEREQIFSKLIAQEKVMAQAIIDRQREVSTLNTRITRLNVWLDFVHTKVFGNSVPIPLQQMPP